MKLSGGEFRRFALVGLIVAGLYVVLYLLLLDLGMGKPLANTVAFLIAVTVQYVGQAAFTFEARLKDSHQILRFMAMIGLGLFTSTAITALVGPMLGLADWIAAITVTVVLPLQNYVLMRHWVFNPVRKETRLP
ncbi:MAG: GtrA family protein [Pseudomonadota bacterium]